MFSKYNPCEKKNQIIVVSKIILKERSTLYICYEQCSTNVWMWVIFQKAIYFSDAFVKANSLHAFAGR